MSLEFFDRGSRSNSSKDVLSCDGYIFKHVDKDLIYKIHKNLFSFEFSALNDKEKEISNLMKHIFYSSVDCYNSLVDKINSDNVFEQMRIINEYGSVENIKRRLQSFDRFFADISTINTASMEKVEEEDEVTYAPK